MWRRRRRRFVAARPFDRAHPLIRDSRPQPPTRRDCKPYARGAVHPLSDLSRHFYYLFYLFIRRLVRLIPRTPGDPTVPRLDSSIQVWMTVNNVFFY